MNDSKSMFHYFDLICLTCGKTYSSYFNNTICGECGETKNIRWILKEKFRSDPEMVENASKFTVENFSKSLKFNFLIKEKQNDI